jgi:toxin HigB-1
VEIRSIAHKGLRKLIESGVASGVPAKSADKLVAMFTFLSLASDVEAIRRLQAWKAHKLTGDRKGVWSLSVTRNWRLTFEVSGDNAIENLNLEDYH